MEDAADGDRVGEEARCLAEAALVVHGGVLAGVEVGVPVLHVDHEFIILGAGVFEFGKEAAGAEVVVVFIDFAQDVADFDVLFVVVCPMIF